MSNSIGVDSSVIAQLFVAEPTSAQVRQWFQKNVGELLFVVPDIIVSEVTNVVWKYVRFHGLDQARALAITDELVATDFYILDSRPFLKFALQVGLDKTIAVYDALHIAIAITLDIPLLTSDKRQAAIAREMNIEVQFIE